MINKYSAFDIWSDIKKDEISGYSELLRNELYFKSYVFKKKVLPDDYEHMRNLIFWKL